MKRIILPLLLGLLLTGCSQDDTTKVASSSSTSSSQSAASTSQTTTKDPAAMTHQDTAAPASSSVAASQAPTSTAEAKASAEPSATASAASPSIGSAAATTAPAASSIAATPSVSAAPASTASPPPLTSPTADSAATSSAITLALRISEWRLGSDDIRDEFDKTGRIERTKAAAAGAPTGPMNSGVITNLVRNKFSADAAISALNLSIEAKDNTVTLSGTAHSLDQIGRAMACALDTEGVNNAVSLIKLDSTPR